ncbi:phosphatase PAP2 family protein [Neptuniibacter sp. 1_MG-2023]|uniref:phosphatase PAP2 family protein n=1 Tax=Neptuniibacter sp. 1_MG-2023 TaxID=3062662 RepID=UPI0026E1E8E7|nr:phosphatase PAP2 family protein [Neptuniibacter sp. 1_MG-2023]MDO6593535.1 phosphatase PAP2 family protein [Neptuniibacter sp. 1_MG-2023]
MNNHFWYKHLGLPLLCSILLFSAIAYWQLDISLANYVYILEGRQWLYKDHWFFSTVLHTDARNLMISLLLIVFISLISSFFVPQLLPFRKAIVYLLLSTTLSALLITTGKHFSQIDCPWDLVNYGGKLPFISYFHARPEWMPDAQCFPAGHASAGYAWFGLYFLALKYCPQWKWLILGGILCLGLLFGAVQQLRGAHFISHDLATLTICWLTALLLYPLFFSGKVNRLITPFLNRKPLKHS